MKTAHDPRHLNRKIAVQELFAETFTHQKNISKMTKNIISQIKAVDGVIANSAPAWPLDKLNKIDLAILRLSVYEMKNTQTPPKVIIDEAVELAKEFGSEASPSFINGVLGTILKEKDE
jgi:transcription antitermination protein NusB